MMKTRITRFSKRSLSTFMAFLVMLSAIGFGSIIRAGAAGNTMYVCVSDATMASAGATKVSTNVRQNQYSSGSWREVQMTSTNKFYNGKRIYSVSNMEGTDWGGLGRLEIILRDDNGTFKAEKWIYSDDNWHTSSNYAGKLYNYDGSTFVGAYSDASYANGFTTGDYYIHNNVNGAWYGNGTSAPQMTKSGSIYYYDFYLKKNEVDTSNYLIFKFWDSSDSLQIGPDYESDHRCTLSTSDSWSSTVQSIQNYGDKDTAWQVNTSGFTTDKFNRVRITFDPTTLANSRNGRVKFTKTELADMDPTFSTTSFTKGTSYNLTDLVGVTSGSNAGTVSYSTYQYYDTSWHTISSPASWTPSATNITKLRVTATDGGVITTSGTTKNAVTARSETKETNISVGLANHNVTRTAPTSGTGTLQLSSDGSTWGTSTLSIAEDSNYYVKATPAEGYKIKTLTIGGSTISEAAGSTSAYTYTGTMGTSNVATSVTFEKITYTVSYNKGTATGATGSNYSATKTYGETLTLRGSTYTRTGYTQKGWSTAQAGATKDYDLSGSYTANAGTTLYPYWEINTYAVTLSETGTTGGTLKVDGTVASTATHGSHTFRVDAPSGYEISSISSTGATWTNNESYATSNSVSITGAYTISVTYIKSAKPALRIDYTGAAGTTYTATNGDSVTTSTRHNVTATFTNQSSFDDGTSYSWQYTKGGTVQSSGSGTTSSSGGNITLKSAGKLTSAGTYVFSITVGTKTTSITVVVNTPRALTVSSVSNTTVSGTYTNEFGQTSQTISAAGTYYCKTLTTYSVTYTAAANYCFSDSDNTETTKTYSGTISAAVTTNPTVYEKKYTLTLNKTVAGTTSEVGTYTIKPVTGTDITAPTQNYYTLSNYTVTSGSVTVNGTSYATNSTIPAGDLTAVKATADATIRANFTENSYTLTINQKKGSGTATSKTTQTVKPVTTSTVSSWTVSGYSITGWTVTSGTVYVNGTAYAANSTISTAGSLSNVTIRAAATIQANFSENTYTVTVESATQGTKALGTVNPSSVTAGVDTKPTITATAKTGYEFTEWTGSNLTFTSSTSASTTVAASAAGTATANFRRTRVYLDVGSVWAIGTNNVNHFAAYFFWNNDANNQWVTMTAVDGVDGKYYADIPAAAVTAANYKIVFVALNSATNAWDNKVYQTDDLTPCTSGYTLMNLYTLGNESNGKRAATLATDAYFPPVTYNVIVNASEHGKVDGATTVTKAVVDDQADNPTALPTPEADYGYKFTGWELISGSIVYNNTTYSTANTVFSTTASTAIIANAASTVRANFDYNDGMHLRIGGRFRAKNGSGNHVYTTGSSSGDWADSGTAGYLELSYNADGHYYYLNTNDSLANVSSYTYNNNAAYFHIYDSDSNTYWNPSSNHTFTDSNEGASNKVSVVSNSTQNFLFNSSSADEPVTICFDPIAAKVWYTIPARHTVSVGTITTSPGAGTSPGYTGAGGTVTVNSGSSATVSEGTNYTISVSPVAGYELTALAVNGTSIITGYENATSAFTMTHAMGAPANSGDSYSETITATFTAIQYSVNTNKNSSNTGNKVQFKRNNSSAQNTSLVMTVEDRIKPYVTTNSEAGYKLNSIQLRVKDTTNVISGYSNLTNNTNYGMPANNVTVYAEFGAITPSISTINSTAVSSNAFSVDVYAGQDVTFTPATGASYESSVTYAKGGTNQSLVTVSNKVFTFDTPLNIGNSASSTASYTFTITPTNTPESGISATGSAVTVTVNVTYSDTQKAYWNLKNTYDTYEVPGTDIEANDVRTAGNYSTYSSNYSSAQTAVNAGIPAYNATTYNYTTLLSNLTTSHTAVMANLKENTVYALVNSSYTSNVKIYVFDNSNTSHNKSVRSLFSTSATAVGSSTNEYKMTKEGTTNNNKVLYSFTFTGKCDFIIYYASGSNTMGNSDSNKLTGDIELCSDSTNSVAFKQDDGTTAASNYQYRSSTDSNTYPGYYVDIKNISVGSKATTTSAVKLFDDFDSSDITYTALTGDEDLISSGEEYSAYDPDHTATSLRHLLKISYTGSSLAKPAASGGSAQTVAETYRIIPPGGTVSDAIYVSGNNKWKPTVPGRYTIKLTEASLGELNENNDDPTVNFDVALNHNFYLYVAYDEIEVYADMNGNVGTPTIHLTYLDTSNNNAETDLPLEFDMVTGSESIYSRAITLSTLKEKYNLDLIGSGTLTISKISIDSEEVNNSTFTIDTTAARTGTLWLKADSTNMKTFNKIAYGSSTRTFKAVLRDGSTDTAFDNSFADVRGTGIINDALNGSSYEYTVFYAAKDTTANYDFSYNVKAKAEHDITSDDTHYYFDHWELDGDANHATVDVSSGADINLLTAPDYDDGDITYTAVYKPVSAKARVEITYNFEDFDTSDGNYEYDASKTTKDETYVKTVKLGEGALSSYSTASSSNASAIASAVAPVIKSNYFDYTYSTATYNTYDSTTNKYKINASFTKSPHSYKVVVKYGTNNATTAVVNGYYQQAATLQASTYGITSGNYYWCIMEGSTERVLAANQNYIARYVTSNDVNNSVQTIYLKSGTASAATTPNSAIMYSYSVTYYDDDTQKAQHNFYIIDALTSSSGTLVGGGVIYATATNTTANGGTYRQTAAGTHLADDTSRKAYINDILNGTYDKEYKAQTINNVGFRYLPYEKGTDVFRYSDEMGAYIYTFSGTNTNNSSLGTQTLIVFSYFVYKNGSTYTTVVSSTYAECTRYVS
ncbi:MAG: hypothetical protein IJT79_01320 [Ruminococcus sp.]|nr:hypothetical protein [Ruminococcus sp.]